MNTNGSSNAMSVGIDLGGTMVKGVILASDGQIVQECTRDTNDSGAGAFKTEVLAVAKELDVQSRGVPVGLCAPGLADDSNTCIAHMPGRLEGLEGFDWGAFIGVDNTSVLNDAHAAMLAEANFGAAQGKKHAALLTLGTGVGGALLIDGKLHTGWLNRAGHLGHMSQQPFGEAGIVGLPGTLEMAIGNSTVRKRSHGRFDSTKALVDAYLEGHTWATLVWLQSVQSLALGLSSLVNILSPEIFLLSGGITKAEDALFDPLADFMDLVEWRPGGAGALIQQAHFAAQAGAVGAACFAAELST